MTTTLSGAEPASRRGLNIRVKLTLAFGSVLALTLIAGGVGLFSFDSIGASLRQIIDRNLPAIMATQQLAATSGQIAAAAPALISAPSDAARRTEFDALTQKHRSVTALIKTLRDEHAADPTAIEAVGAVAERVMAELNALNAAVEHKLQGETARLAALKRLSDAHEAFLKLLAAGIDSANFDLVLASEDLGKPGAGKGSDAIERGISGLRGLLELEAEGNLVVGLIGEAGTTEEVHELVPMRDRIGR